MFFGVDYLHENAMVVKCKDIWFRQDIGKIVPVYRFSIILRHWGLVAGELYKVKNADHVVSVVSIWSSSYSEKRWVCSLEAAFFFKLSDSRVSRIFIVIDMPAWKSVLALRKAWLLPCNK